MGVEDLDRDELLDELRAVIDPPRPEIYMFCARDIATQDNCSVQKAKGKLESAWGKGLLERRYYEMDGKSKKILFYWVKGKEHDFQSTN